jgi:hypothetical protein
MPIVSVATRVLELLQSRLETIDGTAPFVHDVSGAVALRRPVFDADRDPLPVVFISRRLGTGDTRDFRQGSTKQIARVVTFDVVGLVAGDGSTPGLEAEALLADIERALERADDEHLKDPTTGINLLSEPLMLVEPVIDDSAVRTGAELVGVGVRCAWPHRYGDPAFVQR